MQVELADSRQNMKPGHTSFPVKALATIMKELQHEWVDVMKMDIEGTEWGVLKSLVTQKAALPFTQLQVCTQNFLDQGIPCTQKAANLQWWSTYSHIASLNIGATRLQSCRAVHHV